MTGDEPFELDHPQFIDPAPVRKMRAQEEAAAEKLRAQIAELQDQLAVREARISVLDEVLSRCKAEPVPLAGNLNGGLPGGLNGGLNAGLPGGGVSGGLSIYMGEGLDAGRSRATASSMADRRDAVVSVFEEHGDMSPRELLPLVNAQLGEELLAHQLRAVLRKYRTTFESRADQHGVWGLVGSGVS